LRSSIRPAIFGTIFPRCFGVFASSRSPPLVCWIRCITFGGIPLGCFENPRVRGGGSGGSSHGMWRNIAVAPGIPS